MLRTNETIALVAIDDYLVVQGQMATLRHSGETELAVAHLISQIRGFADLESRRTLTELVGGGRRYNKSYFLRSIGEDAVRSGDVVNLMCKADLSCRD
jgi:hypothetical protein